MKVLILAYDFNPLISVGAQRPASWQKYLPGYGIETVVVTRHWDEDIKQAADYIRPSTNQSVLVTTEANTTTIRTPYKPNLRDRIILKYGEGRFVLLRRFLSMVMSIGRYLFPFMDSHRPIYLAAQQYLKEHKVDAIIATGEPFILFSYASKLSAEFNTPWVADYRDVWTGSLEQHASGLYRRFEQGLFARFERRYISNVAFISTASPTYRDILAGIHPGKRIEVVYNGNDINNPENILQEKASNHVFTIAYAGIFYAHQKLEMFLQGFALFLKDRPREEIALIFYGLEYYPEMKSRILRFDATINDCITITPRIPYQELMVKLRKAHALLLLTDKGRNWLNAKVFDYLALKRPILLVENDKGILEKLVDEADAGYKAESAEEVCAILEKLYQVFKNAGEPQLAFRNSNQYNRKAQAGVLAGHLKKL